MKKIFWFIILLWTLYIILVFLATDSVKKIEKIVWGEGTAQKIVDMKNVFNDITVDVPTQNELSEQYNSTVKSVVNIKDTIIDWIDTTKGTIDSVRETLSWAEDTYNQVKDTYDQAKEVIDSTTKTLSNLQDKAGEIKKIVNDASNTVSSGSTHTWTLN